MLPTLNILASNLKNDIKINNFTVRLNNPNYDLEVSVITTIIFNQIT